MRFPDEPFNAKLTVTGEDILTAATARRQQASQRYDAAYDCPLAQAARRTYDVERLAVNVDEDCIVVNTSSDWATQQRLLVAYHTPTVYAFIRRWDRRQSVTPHTFKLANRV